MCDVTERAELVSSNLYDFAPDKTSLVGEGKFGGIYIARNDRSFAIKVINREPKIKTYMEADVRLIKASKNIVVC